MQKEREQEPFSAPQYAPAGNRESQQTADEFAAERRSTSRRLEYHELGRGSRGPRCCSARSCCNLKCLFEHIGSSGYSVENAALYADTAYRFMLAAGWVRTMPGLVLSIIALIIVTGWVTLGNYKSYLAIMDKFLSGLSCFSDEQKKEILTSLEQGLEELAEDPTKRFWVFVAVVASIFKAGISIYPLYLVLYGVLNWLFSTESIWPASVLVFIIATFNLFATVAFFNQGNAKKKIATRRGYASEEESSNSVDEDIQLDSLKPRVVMVSDSEEGHPQELAPSAQLALVSLDDIESRSQTAGCCKPGCCCNTYCFLQHSGSTGYSLQNAALYSNSAYQFMFNWGWITAQPKLSYSGLILGTASVTAANYKSYLAIMDNFLHNFLGMSRSNSNGCIIPYSREFWLINTFLATGVKVGISAATLFRLCNRLFYDYFGVLWPSVTFTSLISAANVIATVGFFRQEVAITVQRPDENLERVVLLSDDYDENAEIEKKVQLDMSRLY